MGFSGLSWYASPDGGWRGDGSREKPWSLERALAHPPEVQPGDVIFLLDGLYQPRSPLVSRLKGTAEAPIELRGDPESGPARIDTAAAGGRFGLRIAEIYARYVGFELFNSSPERWTDQSGGEGDPRGIGLLCEGGIGTELIDLVVHDFGTSLFESQASGLAVRGCLFFNSYWDAPDRSHGPGLYVRNPKGAPRKWIEDNVVFQHGRQGLQGFGSIPFANVGVEGNVFFNNGIAGDGFHRNVMFGNASADHEDLAFRDNLMYLTPGGYRGHEHNLLGGDGGSRGLDFTGNWVVHHGREALRFQRAETPVLEGNRVFGGVYYSSFDGAEELRGAEFESRFPGNDYYAAEPSGETWVWRREHGQGPDFWRGKIRLTVAVLCWSGELTAGLCLDDFAASENLEGVESVRVCSVQEPGVWKEIDVVDAAVTIPLTGWTAVWPAGRAADDPLPRTLPEFGVFLVEWTAPGWVGEQREPAPLADPGIGLPAEERRAARLAAWQTADEESRAILLAERRRAWREALRKRGGGAGPPMKLIFVNFAQSEAFRSAVDMTPAIEGGAGATKLGRAALRSDGKAVISHCFAEADLDWIRAFSDGMEITIEVPNGG